MRTINDLRSDLKNFGNTIRYEIPKNIATVMLKETHENFSKSEYGNDGTKDKWEKRYYDIHKTPIGIKLRYKPLMRTGALYRSYKTYIRRMGSFNMRVGIHSNLSRAKLHNEGGKAKGRWVQPEYKIDRPAPTVQARKHAGIGSRTMRRIRIEIDRTLKKNFK